MGKKQHIAKNQIEDTFRQLFCPNTSSFEVFKFFSKCDHYLSHFYMGSLCFNYPTQEFPIKM